MKKIFLMFFFITALFAVDINNLLYKIALENDLSRETKKENSGILLVLTRQDIDSLQITHLRDLLKILPIGYSFNRFGIIDHFNPNTNIPFLSSPIKVFIDNQEIVSGFYNSGLALLDDIDLNWVDHVEVYSQSPSYDISVEPSFIIIKLYTKRACRDEGNSVYLSKGSKNSYLLDFQRAEHAKYPYYFYISKNRSGSDYHDTHRDNQAILHIYTEDSSLILYALKTKEDGFLGFSTDGDVNNSFIKNNYFHLGFNTKIDNFTFYIAGDMTKNKTYYFETPALFVYNNIPIQNVNIESFDRVWDLGVKFKKEFKKNILLLGLKGRLKYFNWNKLQFNNFEIPQTSRNNQNVYSAYLEYSRFLQSNSIINFGYSYSYYQNDGGIENQKTHQYRVSNTYLKNKFVFKTCLSHIEYTMDPYLINSIYVAKNILKPVKIDDIFEDIKYKNLLKTYEFILGFFIAKDYYVPNDNGLLDNSVKRIRGNYLKAKWDYFYRAFSKLSIEYDYRGLSNLPKISKFKIHKFIIYNYNTFKKWNIFEELITTKRTNSKYFYNLSAGAKYFVNDDLTFFIKGENLLDKGITNDYFSYDPISKSYNLPIKVPMIEKRITLGMEYSF